MVVELPDPGAFSVRRKIPDLGAFSVRRKIPDLGAFSVRRKIPDLGLHTHLEGLKCRNSWVSLWDRAPGKCLESLGSDLKTLDVESG